MTQKSMQSPWDASRSATWAIARRVEIWWLTEEAAKIAVNVEVCYFSILQRIPTEPPMRTPTTVLGSEIRNFSSTAAMQLPHSGHWTYLTRFICNLSTNSRHLLSSIVFWMTATIYEKPDSLFTTTISPQFCQNVSRHSFPLRTTLSPIRTSYHIFRYLSIK